MPEMIGYLRAMGLDYGWGPTSLMQWLLEHIHIWSGASWCASIVLLTVAMRLVLLRPYMAASDTAARLAHLAPKLKPFRDKAQQAASEGDRVGQQAAMMETMRMYREHGIKIRNTFIPFIQLPLGFGAFRLYRGMAEIPVPGLLDGGWLWFTNLSIPDPYLVLPVATAGVLHLVLRVSQPAQVDVHG